MKLYLKKIWSLNPKKYEYITLSEAELRYREYVITCIKAGYDTSKTFEQWLNTEI